MDILMFAIAYLAGGLSFYLLFGGTKVGPFERGISENLLAGKRVIVSIDDECYIFEMVGTKVRITQGTTEFYGGEGYDSEPRLEHLSLVDSAPDKSDDDSNNCG